MKERIYFPNLNGLRFIAAFMVVICHVELNKMYFGLSNARYAVKDLGVLGVDLFFVLSGFLITFLLLKEKEKFSAINFRSFYFRRILRIWPLYYLIVLLSIFVLPYVAVFQIPGHDITNLSLAKIFMVLLLFVFMLPNVLFFIKGIPFATQTWSIGTEEQFYLIWPFLINNVKKLFSCFLVLIITYWFLWFGITSPFLKDVAMISVIKGYYSLMKIDVLTIGALTALILHAKHKLFHVLCNMSWFVVSLFLLTATYFYVDDKFSILRVIHSALFAIIILNLVANSKLAMIFENSIFSYLGKISYGIYMYHGLVIVLVINVLTRLNWVNDWSIYIFSVLITLVLSHLSYQYFEKYFLNIKMKYSPFENEK